MEKNNEWYAIGKDFCLSDEALYQFTAAFREDMEAALAGKESPYLRSDLYRITHRS